MALQQWFHEFSVAVAGSVAARYLIRCAAVSSGQALEPLSLISIVWRVMDSDARDITQQYALLLV